MADTFTVPDPGLHRDLQGIKKASQTGRRDAVNKADGKHPGRGQGRRPRAQERARPDLPARRAVDTAGTHDERDREHRRRVLTWCSITIGRCARSESTAGAPASRSTGCGRWCRHGSSRLASNERVTEYPGDVEIPASAQAN